MPPSDPNEPSGMAPGASSWPPRELLCRVEEAFLPHLIVVSVESPVAVGANDRIQRFQGALIDVTNASNSPFFASHDFHSRLKEDNPRDFRTDSILSRRHTYFDGGGGGGGRDRGSHSEDAKENRPKLAASGGGGGGVTKRLGVRLRARQVLCHSCKNVCNEKGENVQQRGTYSKATQQSRSNHKREEEEKAKVERCSLVPRIKRLDPSEIERCFSDKDRDGDESVSPPTEGNLLKPTPECSVMSAEDKKPLRIRFSNLVKDEVVRQEQSSRTLRKKRSAIGSMEDLWDESAFEEGNRRKKMLKVSDDGNTMRAPADVVDGILPPPPPPKTNCATVLKISFGSEGTVVKIPAASGVADEEESEESSRKKKDAKAKAAKKALKRARKEAQIRAMNGGVSPSYYRSSVQSPARLSSPFAHPAGFSPARYGMSPAHGTSGFVSPARSPAYSVSMATSQSLLVIRKHKRKKHKKKKTLQTSANKSSIVEEEKLESMIPSSSDERVDDEIVSSTSSVAAVDPLDLSAVIAPPSFIEVCPEQLAGQTVDSCEMANGQILNNGNVVWVRATTEHPWWPGRVASIYLRPDLRGDIQPEATVYLYGLEIMSLFLCSELKIFREHFHDCFLHHYQNPLYDEAVRQATDESHQQSLLFHSVGGVTMPYSPSSSGGGGGGGGGGHGGASPAAANSPRTVGCLS